MSLDPQPQDFQTLNSWGLDSAPLAAFHDFRPWKAAARWLKPSHTWQHVKLLLRRQKMHRSGTDLQEYYSKAVIDHEPVRWDYLKHRKAWYIPPWNWERFAAAGCRGVLDVGCGDGDVTHRIAEIVAGKWGDKSPSSPLKVVGLDLNRSRIDNAARFAKTPHPGIHLEFQVANAVKHIPFADQTFDYTVATGVFEAVDDVSASSLLAEMARVTARGIYIEDPADCFPGGFARNNLPEMLRENGFARVASRTVLSEPFQLFGRLDPCWKQMIMPLYKISLIWAER